jgi:hypothetical protein
MLAGTGLVTLLAVIMAGSLTTAASPPTTDADVHCVGLVQHVNAGSDEAKLVSETCFETFAEAMSFAATDSVDGITSTVIGVDYDYPNYDSSHATYIWQAASGCTPTSGWIVNTMPSGWNDRVSSAIGSSGCTWYGHYEDDYRGGSLRICNCATMGVMNNQTSSEWWKQ